MERKTRDKFAALTSQNLTQGNACLETPPQIYQKLALDFGPFDLDLTADAQRALCPRWFGPGGLEEDALSADWRQYGASGYSNPPYGSFVGKMLKKAKLEAKVGFSTTLLLPARFTKAFHECVIHGASELWFCDKRISFWENGAPKLDPATKKPTGALFDSMIVRFAPGMRFSPPRVATWHVPLHWH